MASSKSLLRLAVSSLIGSFLKRENMGLGLTTEQQFNDKVFMKVALGDETRPRFWIDNEGK